MTSRQMSVAITFIVSVSLSFVIWLAVTTVDSNSRFHGEKKIECMQQASSDIEALVCSGIINNRTSR